MKKSSNTKKLILSSIIFIIILFVVVSASMASVSAAVDVNGSIVSVNESSTIQDGLDAHGANNTIYLNNNSYNGTGNSNFSISDRNVTIIGNGT